MSEIKDSGERRNFTTGAVRDCAEGKGRFDLMPLDIISNLINNDSIILNIDLFMKTGNIDFLYKVLHNFSKNTSLSDMLLDVSKHFEEGCKKYGVIDENNLISPNMMKGIPIHCYIDSGVRHYIKYLGGWEDEPHNRAFIWNIMMACWTKQNKPELDDINHKTFLGL